MQSELAGPPQVHKTPPPGQGRGASAPTTLVPNTVSLGEARGQSKQFCQQGVYGVNGEHGIHVSLLMAAGSQLSGSPASISTLRSLLQTSWADTGSKSSQSVLKRWGGAETSALPCPMWLSAARLTVAPLPAKPFHSLVVKHKMKLAALFPPLLHESVSLFRLGSNCMAHVGFPPSPSGVFTVSSSKSC